MSGPGRGCNRRGLGWLRWYAEQAAGGNLERGSAKTLRKRHGLSWRQAYALRYCMGGAAINPKHTTEVQAARIATAWLEFGGPPFVPSGTVDDEPAQDVYTKAPSADTSYHAPTVEQSEDGVRVVANACLLRSLDSVLEACSIDLDRWMVVAHRVKPYTQAQKGSDGEPVVIQLFSHEVRLEPRLVARRDAPARIEVVQRDDPQPAPDGVRPVLVVPDTQVGFRWHRGRLEPMHDRRAMDVALQVARLVQPSAIIHLGDMLDLAPASTKFARPAELLATTEPTIHEWSWWLGQFAAALDWWSPPSLDVASAACQTWIEGNHEQRWTRAMVEKLPEHATLPGMRIEAQLDLAAVGCDYVGPYGAEHWLDARRKAVHSDKVRSGGGATAAAVVASSGVSVVYGHVHKRELAARTVHGRSGPREVIAWSPGCLCRNDGAVPGLDARPDWQHGVGLWWIDGDEQDVELVAIQDGRARLHGRTLYGEDPAEQIAEATGWGAIAG